MVGDFKKDCGCSGCSLWLRLEAERVKSTKPAPKPLAPIVLGSPDRDKVFFDAGRFAAGHRDKAAILANELIKPKRKRA